MKEDLPGLIKYLTKKYGYFKGLIIPVIILGILISVFYFWGKSSTTNIITTIKNQNGEPDKNKGTLALETNASDKEDSIFAANLKDWTVNYYKFVESTGAYCPNIWSPYPAPDMVYKISIPALFKSLYFKYLINNIDSQSTTPQTFVFSLGEKQGRIYRFYIPQTNPHSVGFERYSATKNGIQSHKYDPGKQIDDPIKPETPVELKVSAQQLAGSKVNYVFTMSYISKVTNKKSENSVIYEVDLQDPNPAKILTNIGIATFKGNCINFERYNFIY